MNVYLLWYLTHISQEIIKISRKSNVERHHTRIPFFQKQSVIGTYYPLKQKTTESESAFINKISTKPCVLPPYYGSRPGQILHSRLRLGSNHLIFMGGGRKTSQKKISGSDFREKIYPARRAGKKNSPACLRKRFCTPIPVFALQNPPFALRNLLSQTENLHFALR